MIKPYKEKIQENISYRTFSENILEHELVWHRDREDRIVEALEETDWLLQMDNSLPKPITKLFIPKGVYHRVIKGTKELKLKIKKLTDG